jgi:hypothetical protein
VDGGGDSVVGRLAGVDVARFPITSLAFMLVEVPDPVWKMSRGKSPSRRPSMTSWAAWRMAAARRGSSDPCSSLTAAAWYLIIARAWMKRRGKTRPETGKLRRARSVCAP